MIRPIPPPPPPVENFFLALLFLVFLPLLPIGFEFWTRSSVTISTLSLTAAMYSLTVGATAGQRWIFGFCIVASLIFSMVFGISTTGAPLPPHAGEASSYGILLAALLQITTCWNRYLAAKTEFWDFDTK